MLEEAFYQFFNSKISKIQNQKIEVREFEEVLKFIPSNLVDVVRGIHYHEYTFNDIHPGHIYIGIEH